MSIYTKILDAGLIAFSGKFDQLGNLIINITDIPQPSVTIVSNYLSDINISVENSSVFTTSDAICGK